jgi:hypothetical protein
MILINYTQAGSGGHPSEAKAGAFAYAPEKAAVLQSLERVSFWRLTKFYMGAKIVRRSE